MTSPGGSPGRGRWSRGCDGRRSATRGTRSSGRLRWLRRVRANPNTGPTAYLLPSGERGNGGHKPARLGVRFCPPCACPPSRGLPSRLRSRRLSPMAAYYLGRRARAGFAAFAFFGARFALVFRAGFGLETALALDPAILRRSASRSGTPASAVAACTSALLATLAANASRMIRRSRKTSSRASSPFSLPGADMPSPKSTLRMRRSALRNWSASSTTGRRPPRGSQCKLSIPRCARTETTT